MTDNASPLVRLGAKKKLSSSLQRIWCSSLRSTWLRGLSHSFVRYWTTPPKFFMTQRRKFCFCRSFGSFLSIVSFSTLRRELSRAASGLVKVLRKPCDGVTGGRDDKGQQKGRLPKQGSPLANFSEWFGSVSLMNTLYVWFRASWAPSVVEAIMKRNQTWLATSPPRDPAVFAATERAEGQASRAMIYKIQKWNVKSSKVFPILLANTRVDWLGLDDREITQRFPVLLEGILRDVFSQRTAAGQWYR